MKKNFYLFILVSIAITGSFIGIDSLVPHLPSGLQSLVNFGLFLGFFWVPFEFIVRVIYRMSGATSSLWQKLPRLTHKQAETVNRYWLVWLVSSLLSGLIFTFALDRNHWKSMLIFGGAFGILILLSLINQRFKIAGHTKEEIFK